MDCPLLTPNKGSPFRAIPQGYFTNLVKTVDICARVSMGIKCFRLESIFLEM